jgi:hypothetical protein
MASERNREENTKLIDENVKLKVELTQLKLQRDAGWK